MIAVTIIAVGKVKEKRIASLIDDYTKRFNPYVRLKLIEIGAVPFNTATLKAAQAKEEALIAKRLETLAGLRIFLLSEDGQNMPSSMEFSKMLGQPGETVFVIGGASGFSSAFKARYPRLSLSRLTFTHEMARLLLYEQVYRAATISSGKDYHY